MEPGIAELTIFGTIARELRKYNVTLLIVDQRPSGIDPEVMSQIGTRVTCLLDDESDIRAVFSGVSGGAPPGNLAQPRGPDPGVQDGLEPSPGVVAYSSGRSTSPRFHAQGSAQE